MTASTFPPQPASGTQFLLRSGPYTAAVASIGATLRELRHDGRDLIVGFAADTVRPAYRGAVLIPWPNRLADGRYRLGDHTYQLPVSEPQRNNALHGLACWSSWEAVSHSDDAVTLAHRIVPQDGYPFDIGATVTYRLTPAGLEWSVSASNLGTAPAPLGIGSHAYLIAGPGSVDDWTLSVPASQVLDVDPERLLPTQVRQLAESPDPRDFRDAHRIDDTRIDHAFTGFTPSNPATVVVSAADGSGTALTWDATVLPWAQIYTGDNPDPDLNRSGVAVEPMTCPPDAFNSGIGLILLEPGATTTATWSISHRPAPAGGA